MVVDLSGERAGARIPDPLIKIQEVRSSAHWQFRAVLTGAAFQLSISALPYNIVTATASILWLPLRPVWLCEPEANLGGSSTSRPVAA